MRSMQKYLDLPSDQQDKLLKMKVSPVTVQIISLKSWVRSARQVNPDLRIAIKADASTPYAVIEKRNELTSGPQREPVQPDYFSEDYF